MDLTSQSRVYTVLPNLWVTTERFIGSAFAPLVEINRNFPS